MSIWDKVDKDDFDEAEGFVKSPYLNEEGRYLIRIVCHKTGPSHTNKHKIKFIPEFEIVQTAHATHPVGSRRSDVMTIDTGDAETAQTILGKVKAHMGAVMNLPQLKVKLSILKELEQSPFKYEGTLLFVDVLPPFLSKKKKTKINPRQYIHIPKDKYDEVLAIAAKAAPPVAVVETVAAPEEPALESGGDEDLDW